MNEDVRMPEKRFTLKGWHIALAILVVLVGLIGLYFVVRKNKVEERVKALRAAGYPTTFAELTEYTKLPAGVENAAEVYLRAFAVFVRPVDDPNVPVLGAGHWPDRGVPLPKPMTKGIADCLADNRQCLALLHEAVGIEHCRYDSDYNQMMSQGEGIRHSALLLNLSTIYHANQGDAAAALACIKGGLRVGDSLQKEPALISHLVRIACIAVALGGLERSLSLTTFTDPQLKELSDALTRTGSTLDFAQVLVTERCFMIETCRNPWRSAPPGQSPPPRMFPGFRQTWLGDTLDFMAEYIETAQQPPVERLAQFRQTQRKIDQLPFWHMMIRISVPALGRAGELDLRVRAHLDLAQTALALERHRLATGKLPQQLDELVPQYLEKAPLDPFDGQPIRYHPGTPGYVLYSIGEDGHDNGGRERSEKDRQAPYDLCFIVTR